MNETTATATAAAPVPGCHVTLTNGLPTSLRVSRYVDVPAAVAAWLTDRVGEAHAMWLTAPLGQARVEPASQELVVPLRPLASQPTHRITFHGPLGVRTWLVALQPAPYGASQHFAMECHDGTLISSAWSFAPETGAWRHHGCATPQNQSGVVEIETLPPPGARW